MAIEIWDNRLSDLIAMKKLFEDYCKSREIKLQLTMVEQQGMIVYVNKETQDAFVWFLRGVFAGCLDDFTNISN